MNKSVKVTERQTVIGCARYLKAVADPIRLQVVRILQNGPMTVSDISLFLDIELANISHHLRVLFNAKVVTTQRDGKYIYYSINEKLFDPGISKDSLDFGCCKLDMRAVKKPGEIR